MSKRLLRFFLPRSSGENVLIEKTAAVYGTVGDVIDFLEQRNAV